MAKNHVQPGAVMPWTNGTGSNVASGAVVVVGQFVTVALGDIANGEAGELATEEVWEMPKAAGLAMGQGDRVYWDVADGNLNKTAADNFDAGLVFEAAEAAAVTVKVKLGA